MEKKLVKQQLLTGERALFASKDLHIEDSIFDDGESPLKESSNIELVNSSFKWKYPLWYCNNVNVKDCYFLGASIIVSSTLISLVYHTPALPISKK